MFAEHVKEDLHNCLKCGMCQPVCPTYKVTRMERYAPRGRVQMVKKYLEGDLSITQSLQEALMSCILCESCAQACPSGVRLDRVFENMRMELHETLGEGFAKRTLFAALQNPMLTRLGAKVARIGQQVFVTPLNIGWRIGKIPLNRFPTFNATPFRASVGELVAPKGKRKGRVLYFTGCATDLINEHVGRAVVGVLTHLGIEVLIPRDQVCCSVPVFLSGARREALRNVKRNVALLDRSDVDAIVVDCATCGGALKKAIPHLMEDLALDGEQALRVASKVRDISEIVVERLDDLEFAKRSSNHRVRVTYHDPCHLVRSMKIAKEPRRLLGALEDVEFVEMAGADQCCGGAGSFQFEHVEVSAAVTARKKEMIRATGGHVVATGCPGCNLTLRGNLGREDDPDVKHPVELLWERLQPTPG